MLGFSLTKVREIPWVSFGLFYLTYGAFGWLIGEKVMGWQAWILAHAHWLPWAVNPAIAAQIGWSFGAFLVFLLMVILTAPLRIIQILLGSWVRSDTKAFARVLAWAFMAVLVVCWLDLFAHLFVLVSAGILCHLDLQLRGCSVWQIFVILTAVGLLGFALGGYFFTHFYTVVTL